VRRAKRTSSRPTSCSKSWPSRSARRQGIDALRDQAVLEDLVVRGDRRVADADLLGQRAEADEVAGLERGHLEETREAPEVAHERLGAHLLLEVDADVGVLGM
jgi:hypothetical protein